MISCNRLRGNRPGTTTLIVVLCVVATIGCNRSSQHSAAVPSSPPPPPPSAAGAPPPPPPIQIAPAQSADDSVSSTGQPVQARVSPADRAESAEETEAAGSKPNPVETSSKSSDESRSVERVVAEPGVGQAGRSLDELDGPLVRPAKEYFSFREKAIFQISIPQAMQFFKAAHGRHPSSHDEFMDRIIKSNQIQLPQLPSSHRYVYDPKSAELLVERPSISNPDPPRSP